jgi:hypothetical protein
MFTFFSSFFYLSSPISDFPVVLPIFHNIAYICIGLSRTFLKRNIKYIGLYKFLKMWTIADDCSSNHYYEISESTEKKQNGGTDQSDQFIGGLNTETN